MTPTTLRVLAEPPVVEIVFARPEKRNAMDGAMLNGLRETFAAFAGNDDVRVVVVSAEGPDFCAGFDLHTVDAEEPAEDRMAREREQLFELSLTIRDHPSPTIALVQGMNAAAGLLISQACDLVVASEDASFYDPLPRMGGVGLEVLLEPYDIGFRRAKRHLFTGERIPAALAAQYGMVTDLVPRGELAAFGRDLARRVAEMPPTTLRYLKRSLNNAEDLAGRRAALDYHFLLHQLGHQTRESRLLLHERRQGRKLREYFDERDRVGLEGGP